MPFGDAHIQPFQALPEALTPERSVIVPCLHCGSAPVEAGAGLKGGVSTTGVALNAFAAYAALPPLPSADDVDLISSATS